MKKLAKIPKNAARSDEYLELAESSEKDLVEVKKRIKKFETKLTPTAKSNFEQKQKFREKGIFNFSFR